MPGKVSRYAEDSYRRAAGYFNSAKYAGDAYYCPCCGGVFGAFMDFPLNDEEYRRDIFAGGCYKNMMCPSCFSLPRHRMECDYLGKNAGNILKSGQNLIFGAEYGMRMWFKKNGFACVTADLLDPTADRVIDIQSIPSPDSSWSVIICNHVLEHVSDYGKTLGELRRVLAIGGTALLTVPTDALRGATLEAPVNATPEQRRELAGQVDHLRIFGKDFPEKLLEAGFSVTVLDGDKIPGNIAPFRGPAYYDDNKVYVCGKERLA